MSIVITFYPERSDKRGLRALLTELGFVPSAHLWDWPKGASHFRWFSDANYESYVGVEATIFPPDETPEQGYPACAWALHTRTRAWASPADLNLQNHVIRTARARFGGAFHNDSAGKNRYTKVEDDGRDAASRGIYLAYEATRESVNAVKYGLPEPAPGFAKFTGTDLAPLAELDPIRVLYNAPSAQGWCVEFAEDAANIVEAWTDEPDPDDDSEVAECMRRGAFTGTQIRQAVTHMVMGQGYFAVSNAYDAYQSAAFAWMDVIDEDGDAGEAREDAVATLTEPGRQVLVTARAWAACSTAFAALHDRLGRFRSERSPTGHDK